MEGGGGGEGNPVCPLAVWDVGTGGDRVVLSGLCPCFGSAA